MNKFAICVVFALSLLFVCFQVSAQTPIFSTRVNEALKKQIDPVTGYWTKIIFSDSSELTTSFSTSAGLAAALSDETGTELSVFNRGPSLVGNPTIDSDYAADRMVNGDFGTSTGWTVGSGWAISGGVATHTGGGGTATLSRADIVGTVGNLERLKITISGRTAGTITLGIGGQTSMTLSTNTVHTFYTKSVTTGGYIITPTSTFDGSLDLAIVQAQTNGLLTLDGGITVNNGQLTVPQGSSTYPGITFANSINGKVGIYTDGNNVFYNSGTVVPAAVIGVNFALYSDLAGIYIGANSDAVLLRNSPNFLEMRKTTNPQYLRLDGSYTDGNNYKGLKIGGDGVFLIDQQGTGISNVPFVFNQNSSVTGKAVDFQVGGTTTVYWDNKGKAFWGTVGDSTGTPGNATLNTVTGKSAIAAGQTTMTLTNSNIASTSLIDITPLDIDATATTWKYSVDSGGVGTVTVNAAATATWKFSWKVCN